MTDFKASDHWYKNAAKDEEGCEDFCAGGKMTDDIKKLAMILHDVINEVMANDCDTEGNLKILQNKLKEMIE